MDISVTDFKQRCLEIIRRVEQTGKPVSITRHGKVVARLQPSSLSASVHDEQPWVRLRTQNGGRLLASPEESVLSDEDFGASR